MRRAVPSRSAFSAVDRSVPASAGPARAGEPGNVHLSTTEPVTVRTNIWQPLADQARIWPVIAHVFDYKSNSGLVVHRFEHKQVAAVVLKIRSVVLDQSMLPTSCMAVMANSFMSWLCIKAVISGTGSLPGPDLARVLGSLNELPGDVVIRHR
jgi:hypothetical protein